MKKVYYILAVVILTGVTVLCCIRWNAWFYNPPEPHWQNDTVDFRFITFGADSVKGFTKNYKYVWKDTISPDTLRFIVLGDVHNNINKEEWNNIYNRHPHIDFYAQAGDFLERGYFYYYQLSASKIKETPFENLPLIAVPGNHEYKKGIVRRLPEQWKVWFPNPDNGPIRYKGTSYYVDFDKLRFIVIDTNGLHILSDYTTVITWVNKVIKEAEGRFTVVMMHHPVYSSAVGRQNMAIRLFLRRSLEKADIVFSGHDHNYSRRLPFIGTNSADKFYLSKVNDADKRICSGEKLYEEVSVFGNTMRVRTYLMKNGEKYDEIIVKQLPDGSRKYTCDTLLMPEIIKLPEKYENKNNNRVRTFIEKRDLRLKNNVQANIDSVVIKPYSIQQSDTLHV